jgi:hypothetical protein
LGDSPQIGGEFRHGLAVKDLFGFFGGKSPDHNSL